MKDLKEKVAVVTGAASGIGLAFAQRCLKEGMKVVFADIDKAGLKQVERKLKRENVPFLTVPTDVSKPQEMETLCNKVYEQFGACHILYNNAGVGASGYVHTTPLNDWRWVLEVNLFGAINGLNFFLPRMMKQDTEGHILNTASIEGLVITANSAAYCVSKFAIVALTENLLLGLQHAKSKIKASVVCPGAIATNILNSELHRPEEYKNPTASGATMEILAALGVFMQNYPSGKTAKEAGSIAFGKMAIPPPYTLDDMIELGIFVNIIQTGMKPQECADIIFREAIQEENFYILPNSTQKPFQDEIRLRMENILQRKAPETMISSMAAFEEALKKA